jgi:hypothetical protein
MVITFYCAGSFCIKVLACRFPGVDPGPPAPAGDLQAAFPLRILATNPSIAAAEMTRIDQPLKELCGAFRFV